MACRRFAEELEAIAGHIGEVNYAELEALLRRAALLLRNAGEVGFDPDIDAVISAMMDESELDRCEFIRAIVPNWMFRRGLATASNRQGRRGLVTGHRRNPDMRNCTAAASASVLVLVTGLGAFNANADEAAAKSILKATRIADLAVPLSAMPALGAALEHASQKELDQCKLEASRATDNPQADSGRQGGKPKALDILEIAKCMKVKGYMRVEDTAGVCHLLAIVQCFERQ